MMSVAALSFTACGSKQEETPASEEVVDFGKLTGKNDTAQTEQAQKRQRLRYRRKKRTEKVCTAVKLQMNG